MYITPVSLMRGGTEGCPQQLLPILDRDLEGGGGEAEVAHRHLVEEANNILLSDPFFRVSGAFVHIGETCRVPWVWLPKSSPWGIEKLSGIPKRG